MTEKRKLVIFRIKKCVKKGALSTIEDYAVTNEIIQLSLLFVGINYDENTKTHECKIEEFVK